MIGAKTIRDTRNEKLKRHSIHPKFNPSILPMTTALIFFASTLYSPSAFPKLEKNKVKRIEKEFKNELIQSQIEELINLGDFLADRSEYDRAVEAYEQVFVLDPSHVQASAKIDAVKKLMMRNSNTEERIVTEVYDDEIHSRTVRYFEQVRQLLSEEKIGQAKFTLQKLLLIDPLNQEAQSLYNQLTQETPTASHEAREAL